MDDNMEKSRFSVICSDIEIIFAEIPEYLIFKIKCIGILGIAQI